MTILTKVVIPTAGLGTRVLPATKVVPKELLPVVDKPVIQYVVEEAVAAGFSEIILVTRPGKQLVASHFAPNTELEAALQRNDKQTQLAAVRDILPASVRLKTAIQQQPLGLGHAVLCAEKLVAGESFAVSLPDVLVFNPEGDHARDLKTLVKSFDDNRTAQIMVETVADEEVSNYGIVDCGPARFDPGSSHDVIAMLEKPRLAEAPSNQAIIGRYILPPRTMTLLRQTHPGAGGELQLTDAINALAAEQTVQATSMFGRTYDCGNKLGYLMANLEYGLRHPDLGDRLRAWISTQA